MFGGQAMSNALQSGLNAYATVENIKTSIQDRQLRAKAAADEAKLRAEQIKGAQSQNVIASAQAAGYEQLKAELDSLKSQLQAEQGDKAKTLVANVLTAKIPTEQNDALRIFKSRAPKSVLDALDIKDVGNLSLLSEHDIKDTKAYLAKLPGVDATTLTDDNVKKVIDEGFLIKNGGQIVDISAVSAQMGVYDTLTKEQKAYLEDSSARIRNIIAPNKDGATPVAQSNGATPVVQSPEATPAVQSNGATPVAPNKDFAPSTASTVDTEALKAEINKRARQLAGIPADADNRVALEKELDYITKQFPGQDAVEIYRQLKRSSSGGSLAWDERVLEMEKTIMRNEGISEGSTEWNSRLAKTMEQINTKQLQGVGSNVTRDDIEIATNAQAFGSMIISSNSGNGYVIPKNAQEVENRFMTTEQFTAGGINKDFKDFKAQYASTAKIVDLSARVDDYIKRGGNLGIEKSIMTTFATKLPQFVKDTIPEDIAAMDAKDIAESMGIKGESTLIIGEMVKAMYGGQASNRDRETFEAVIRNGAWDNNFAIQESLRNMANVTIKSTKTSGEKLIQAGMVYTPAKYINELTTLKPKSNSNKPSVNNKPTVNIKPLTDEEKAAGWSIKQQNGKYYKVNMQTKQYEEL